MKDWKTNLVSIENNTRILFNAEMTLERFNFLQEKSKELSQKIMETEENLLISSLDTEALKKLKHQIEIELNARLK